MFCSCGENVNSEDLSIVDRPNHTQSWTFVVGSFKNFVSRYSKSLFIEVFETSEGSKPHSIWDGLNLEAYTTHEITKTTMAKQNAVNKTYIPTSIEDIFFVGRFVE